MVNQRKEVTSIDGAMGLIAILLIVPMGRLTATLGSFVAGHDESIRPAAVIPGIIFAACAGLFAFIRRFDAKARTTR